MSLAKSFLIIFFKYKLCSCDWLLICQYFRVDSPIHIKIKSYLHITDLWYFNRKNCILTVSEKFIKRKLPDLSHRLFVLGKPQKKVLVFSGPATKSFKLFKGKKFLMATNPGWGGKGLSGRTTNNRTFLRLPLGCYVIAANTNKSHHILKHKKKKM